MKNFKSVFWVKHNGLTVPATKNLCPGRKFYDEHLSYLNEIELRSWNPSYCRLSSAVLSGLEILPINDGTNVLYFGNSDGITVSHLSDIVGKDGKISFVIEDQPLDNQNILSRENVIVSKNFDEIKEISKNEFDTVFIDTFENIQQNFILETCKNLLKPKGFLIILLQNSDKDRTKILVDEYRKNMNVIQTVELGSYHKKQFLVVAQLIN